MSVIYMQNSWSSNIVEPEDVPLSFPCQVLCFLLGTPFLLALSKN